MGHIYAKYQAEVGCCWASINQRGLLGFVLGLGTVWLHAPPGGNMKCRQWVVTSAIYPNILP